MIGPELRIERDLELLVKAFRASSARLEQGLSALGMLGCRALRFQICL